MAYHLETSDSFSATDAREADVHRALDDAAMRSGYIILTDPHGNFIQAAGDGDGRYTLEHRAAGSGEHVQASGGCSKEQVRDAFLAYLRGDQRWREQFTWQPLRVASPAGTAGVCQRCGKNAHGKRQWMVSELWVDREFYCFACLRVMRIYGIIGGTIAGILIAGILGAWLWLTFWP